VDLDEVTALTALHPHRLAGDLLVRDLVLGLAVIAAELHQVARRKERVRGSGGSRAELTTVSVARGEVRAGVAAKAACGAG
jgi:hypothetical protein